jgi:hypothetical protein
MKRLGYQAIFASALLGVAITPAAAQDPDEHWEGAYIGGSEAAILVKQKGAALRRPF